MKVSKTTNTIKNLNKVLGIEDLKLLPPPARNHIVLKQPAVEQLDYFKFVETVNGRCAIVGNIVGRALFKFSGESLGEQLLTNPDDTVFLFTTVTFTVIFVSMMTVDKYKPASQLAQFEMFAGRWFMMGWLFILFRSFI